MRPPKKWLTLTYYPSVFCRNMSSAQKVRNHFRSHWSYPCFWSVLNGGSTEFSRPIPTCKLPTCWGHSLLLSSWPYLLSTPHPQLLVWHHRNTNTICSSLKRKNNVSLPIYCTRKFQRFKQSESKAMFSSAIYLIYIHKSVIIIIRDYFPAAFTH